MSLQLVMMGQKSEWVPPAELPDLTSAKTIAIDVETKDPDLKANGPGWTTGNGEVVGYAIAADGWSGYLPIRHLGGGNLDERIVNKWLKKVFECPADKIMHNAQYDMGWIRRMGFDIKGRVIDTMLIASLLDENRFSYSLNSLAYDYLNKVKSEKGLNEAAREFGLDPKGEMWKMPAAFVGPYGEGDAELTLELWSFFKGLLGREDLWQIANLELDLLPCLVDMTWRGIRVDMDKVERTRDALLKREKQVMAEIKRMTGQNVEIWAAQSLAKAFDKAGVNYPKTEKGAPSFTKSFLTDHPHELPKLIVQARALNKTSGTFINTIMKHTHKDGRIHSHINQIRSDDGGTVSGRISMNSPNLQQIPARDPELGPMIRSLFLPEEGDQWAAIDFSQQEPRILVHYAHVYGKSRGMALEGAKAFVDRYNNDPDTDFHTMTAEVTGLPRKAAKTCIAEGQLVLTDRGLVPIEKITINHLVWDGVAWVRHEGLVYQGVKEVITYDGLTATADHEVWVGRERTLPLGLAASRLERLARTGEGERPVRIMDDCFAKNTAERLPHLRERAVQVWEGGLEKFVQFAKRAIHGLPLMQYQSATSQSWEYGCGDGGRTAASVAGGGYLSALQQLERLSLFKLRRPRDTVPVPHQARAFRVPFDHLLRRGLDWIRDRPDRQQRRLRSGKSTPCHTSLKSAELPSNSPVGVSRPESGSSASMAPYQDGLSRLRFWAGQSEETPRTGVGCGENTVLPARRLAKVYDIKNAGPRHRFTVSGRLVHNCGLGLVYGMGINKLAEQLDISVEEAKEVRKQFNDRVPFVKGLMDGVTKRLNDKASGGSVRSLLGRKCRFDLWEPDTFKMNKALPYKEAIDTYGATTRLKRAYTYKALNRLIQASAADMTKQAMVNLYKAGKLPMLQVHDELAMSVSGRPEAEEIARVMETAVPLEVPSKCDIEIGPSWGEAE